MGQHLIRRGSAPALRPLPFSEASAIDRNVISLIPGKTDGTEAWIYGTITASLPKVSAQL
jgi:hypothetical protein